MKLAFDLGSEFEALESRFVVDDLHLQNLRLLYMLCYVYIYYTCHFLPVSIIKLVGIPCSSCSIVGSPLGTLPSWFQVLLKHLGVSQMLHDGVRAFLWCLFCFPFKTWRLLHITGYRPSCAIGVSKLHESAQLCYLPFIRRKLCHVNITKNAWVWYGLTSLNICSHLPTRWLFHLSPSNGGKLQRKLDHPLPSSPWFGGDEWKMGVPVPLQDDPDEGCSSCWYERCTLLSL